LLRNSPLCKNVVVVVAYITEKQIPGILGVLVVVSYIIISTFRQNRCHLKGVIYRGPEHRSYVSVAYNVSTLRRLHFNLLKPTGYVHQQV